MPMTNNINPMLDFAKDITDVKVQPLVGNTSMVTAIAVTPDSRFAVSYAREVAPGTFRIWDLVGSKEPHWREDGTG